MFKKGTKKRAFVSGILVGSLGMLAIVAGAYMLHNNSDNNNTDNIQTKELALDSQVVVDLSKIFYREADLDIYSLKWHFASEKTNVVDMSMNLKFRMLIEKLGYPTSITEEDFKKEYKNVFGSLDGYVIVDDNTYVNSSESCQAYDYNDGSYVIDEYEDAGCGGTSNIVVLSKLVDAKKIIEDGQERIEIFEAVASGRSLENGGMAYYKYSKNFNSDDAVIDTYSESHKEKNPLDGDYSKYSMYKYTFVKNSEGIYAFTSVERTQ